MKPRTFASFAVMLVCLTGCNNLNTTVIAVVPLTQVVVSVPVRAPEELPPAPVSQPAASVPLVEPKKVDGSVQLCPVFRTPLLPKKPQLPLQEIDALGPGNPTKLAEIEHRYIEDLHLYINQLNAALAKARVQYELACRPYLKK